MKRYFPAIFATIAAAAILLIFSFGTLDYEISKVLYNPCSVFGLGLYALGELPAYLGAALAVFILYTGRNRDNRKKNILITAGALPAMFLPLFLGLFTSAWFFMDTLYDGMPGAVIPVIIISAVLILAGAVWWSNSRANRNKFRLLKKAAIIMIVLVISEIVIVNLLKTFWARPRFRDINSLIGFKYWYEAGGLSRINEMRSFPSGHTANAFTMIMFSTLFAAKNKKSKNLFLAFAVCWGTCVALSRIIVGAHFLTDTVAAAYITIVLFLILSGKFRQPVQQWN